MSALTFSSAYSSSLVAKLDTTRGLAPNFEPAICLQGQMRMGSVSDHQSSGHNYAPILGQGITHHRQRLYPFAGCRPCCWRVIRWPTIALSRSREFQSTSRSKYSRDGVSGRNWKSRLQLQTRSKIRTHPPVSPTCVHCQSSIESQLKDARGNA